jgi:hypothetical protein
MRIQPSNVRTLLGHGKEKQHTWVGWSIYMILETLDYE